MTLKPNYTKTCMSVLILKSKTPPKGKITAGMQIEKPSGAPMIDRTTGQEYKSFIAVQKPFQSKKNPDKEVTLGQHVLGAFHELGHGIEGRSASETPIETFTSYPNQGKMYPVKGTRSESMRDYMTQIRYAAEGKPVDTPDSAIVWEGTQEEAQAIINDITRMQRQGVLTIQGERTAVRPDYDNFAGAFAELDDE